MIVLDTTVLVYAVGADHPLRDPCRAIVAAVGEGQLVATTTVEVIQEFAHVRARRRGRAEAGRLASEYVRMLSPLTVPEEADLLHGLDLFVSNGAIGAFDSVLASMTLRQAHLRAIVSADRGFASVDGLVHVDPADLDAITAMIDPDLLGDEPSGG